MEKNQKRDLNDIIGMVIMFIISTIFFVVLIGSSILWLHTGSPFYMISGIIGAAGVLTQLFIVYRERLRKQD